MGKFEHFIRRQSLRPSKKRTEVGKCLIFCDVLDMSVLSGHKRSIFDHNYRHSRFENQLRQ